MPATDVPLPTPPALPEQPRARSTDPDTSKAAARSVGALTVKRLAVLRVFELFGPLTDEQLQARYAATGAPGQSPSGIRTRRHELVEQGALVDTGERGRTVSGRAAIVWGLPTGGQDGTPSDTPEGANAGLQTVAKGVL